MDAANIDLKGFSEGFYKNLCSSKLAPVLETLEYLKHETSVWFEITTLLIPVECNSVAEIEAESAWVMDHLGPDVPLHFTARFHPDWKLMDRPATLTAADAAHGPADRHERRSWLSVHRQYSRSSRPSHPLSRVRRRADRPRLVEYHGLASVCGRPMRRLWYALPWCV